MIDHSFFLTHSMIQLRVSRGAESGLQGLGAWRLRFKDKSMMDSDFGAVSEAQRP